MEELVAELLLGIAQFFGEILLQVLLEYLVENGVRGVKRAFTGGAPSPALAALGYATLGAIAGGVSVLVMPTHFIRNPSWRMANLIAAPVLSGLMMALLGAWRRRRGQELIRLDRFGYGSLFALAMALVRFHFAR